jgi:hypothetical protein
MNMLASIARPRPHQAGADYGAGDLGADNGGSALGRHEKKAWTNSAMLPKLMVSNPPMAGSACAATWSVA